MSEQNRLQDRFKRLLSRSRSNSRRPRDTTADPGKGTGGASRPASAAPSITTTAIGLSPSLTLSVPGTVITSGDDQSRRVSPAVVSTTDVQPASSQSRSGLFPLTPELSEEGLRQGGVDIVAIHGINGDYERTWTHPQGVLWLRDFLPRDLSVSTRVFSFGYDAQVKFSVSKAKLEDFARSLLQALNRVRRGKDRLSRPLIFICHSMGGLVLKQALVIARLDSNLYLGVQGSTRGIVFLSTPHRGSGSTDWIIPLSKALNAILKFAPPAVGSTRTDLLNTLESNSDELKTLATNFRNQAIGIKIVSCYETDITPYSNALIVDKHTGTLGFPGEALVPMEGCNHMEVCRFPTRNDTNYQNVLNEILILIEECESKNLEPAIEEVKGRKVDEIDQRHVLQSLPIVKSATYDSLAPCQCHPQTRVDILRSIYAWADNPDSSCVLWLQGKAGTGKSTISQTVANHFNDERALGASFFFKRGEVDRGNATRFFTTIAYQLVRCVPDMFPHIRAAFDEDSTFNEKNIKKQFETLILQPLTLVGDDPGTSSATLVVVIDALDECNSEDDVQLIIAQLPRVAQLSRIRLRFLVTSRPEIPILSKFGEISFDHPYESLALPVQGETIRNDISIYLESELSKTRDIYNRVTPILPLSTNWPSPTSIQILVDMAIPLFIFAKTVCLFIQDYRLGNPDVQMKKFLQYQGLDRDFQLHATYLPVLDQMLAIRPGSEHATRSSQDTDLILKEFHNIVGTIVVLADPLPVISLARLLDIEIGIVAHRLSTIQSVLNISPDPDTPVTLLHLSFREFLVQPGKNPFCVDEGKTHNTLVTKCLDLLSKHLKRDICAKSAPATARRDIDMQEIHRCLSPEVQYACRFWVHHLEKSGERISDGDSVHSFLRLHFLHWLEALSLIGRTSESIALIDTLRELVAETESVELSEFLYDAWRFILQNRWIIDNAPLQLYYAAIFAPAKSKVRDAFRDQFPRWISRFPVMPSTWSPELQQLAGHTWGTRSVAFSPDGKLLASGSDDKTIRLWNVTTGEEIRTLEGHDGNIYGIAFSPKQPFLASGSADESVRLWNTITGELIWTGIAHTSFVMAVAFSPDGRLLASGSIDRTVTLWDTAKGMQIKKFEGHDGSAQSIKFSPNGRILAVLSSPSIAKVGTIRLWDVEKGQQILTVEGHMSGITQVAFSPDGQLLASGSYDKITMLWKTTGMLVWSSSHTDRVMAVSFSPKDQVLASALPNRIELRNNTTGRLVRTLRAGTDGILDIAFSPDGRLLASAGYDKGTIRLWTTATEDVGMLEAHEDLVRRLEFSPDGQLLASASLDPTVRLWKIATGEHVRVLELRNRPADIAFSPDGRTLVLVPWHDTVTLWRHDVETNGQIQELEVKMDYTDVDGSCVGIAFSPDGELLAFTISDDKSEIVAMILNVRTRKIVQKIKDSWDSKSGWVTGPSTDPLAWSPDSQLLAVFSHAGIENVLRVWNVVAGKLVQRVKLDALISSLRFSNDGQRIDTDRGYLVLSPKLTSALQHHTPCMEQESNERISVSGEWIVRDGRNLLWLPLDYRPHVSATRGKLLVMGHKSGRVTFFEFNFEA